MTDETKTRRRSTAKHAAIIQAAVDVIAEIGYSAATIERIAATAGVGKQTIYRWWPSKPALYVEVYTSLVGTVAPPSGIQHCTRELTRFLTALFKTYQRTRAGLILQGLLGDMASDPVAADAVKNGLMLQRAPVLLDAIQQGCASGELDASISPQERANLIVALVWQQTLLDPAKLNAPFARRIVRLATAST